MSNYTISRGRSHLTGSLAPLVRLDRTATLKDERLPRKIRVVGGTSIVVNYDAVVCVDIGQVDAWSPESLHLALLRDIPRRCVVEMDTDLGDSGRVAGHLDSSSPQGVGVESPKKVCWRPWFDVAHGLRFRYGNSNRKGVAATSGQSNV